MTPQIASTIEELRDAVAKAKADGKTTALVPTMGGLHSGHLSLVNKAAELADFVIVSIFVNPTQFDNPVDLNSYPGDMSQDLDALASTQTALVYTPGRKEMYPLHFSTNVLVKAGSGVLCDAFRPGHFDGVATVVTKLFLQTGAQFAVFGEKDYQQLFKIRRLVEDLNIPITIVPSSTIREPDGLAMSSRNARLTDAERIVAPRLHEAMQQCRKAIEKGDAAVSACEKAKNTLQHDYGFRVEYLELRSTETLELVDNAHNGSRLFAAAHLGSVRLIDNIEVA